MQRMFHVINNPFCLSAATLCPPSSASCARPQTPLCTWRPNRSSSLAFFRWTSKICPPACLPTIPTRARAGKSCRPPVKLLCSFMREKDKREYELDISCIILDFCPWLYFTSYFSVSPFASYFDLSMSIFQHPLVCLTLQASSFMPQNAITLRPSTSRCSSPTWECSLLRQSATSSSNFTNRGTLHACAFSFFLLSRT